MHSLLFCGVFLCVVGKNVVKCHVKMHQASVILGQGSTVCVALEPHEPALTRCKIISDARKWSK